MGLLAAVSSAHAADRYVRGTTGSDAANNCTSPAAPCQTIPYTVSQSGCADTIHVHGDGGTPYTLTVTVTATCTPGNELTIQAWNGTGTPVIDTPGAGAEGMVISGDYIVVDGLTIDGNLGDGIDAGGALNLTIRNTTISNSGGQGIRTSGTDGLTVEGSVISSSGNAGIGTFGSGSDDWVIRNNTLTSNGNRGIIFSGGSNVTIDGNRITGTVGNQGIYITDSAAGAFIVTDNVVAGSLGSFDEAISVNTTSGASCLVSGNQVYVPARGIVSRQPGCEIKNNLVYNTWQTGSVGIDVQGDNVLIENNTVHNATGSGIRLGGAFTGTIVRNNILANNGTYGIEDNADSNEPAESNNLFYGNGTAPCLNLNVGKCVDGVNGDIVGSHPLFVDATRGDFHLRQAAAGQSPESPAVDAGNDTAANVGLDGRTTRTDGVTDAGTVDMGYHYEPMASSPTDLYRSVGVDGGDLNTGSRSVSIAGNTATFSGAMPDNIGVGDVLQYQVGGTYYLAFIHGRTSSSAYTVASSTGGTPRSTVGTAVGVYRAYTSLFDWERQVENTSLDNSVEDFDTSSHLLNDDTVMNVAAYGDGPDTTAVVVSGWTTAAPNYIRVFTPVSATDVGTSQRHTGTWTPGAYRLEVAGASVLRIEENFVHVDGLQVRLTTDTNDVAGIDVTSVGGPGAFEVSSSIIRGNGVGTQDIRIGINLWGMAGTGVLKAWNNLIYDWGGGAADVVGILPDDGGYTIYLYDNTVVDCRDGIEVSAGTVIAKNNLVYGSTSANYVGGFDAVNSTNNLSGPVMGGAPGASPRDGVTVTFVNAVADDFHLASADTGARGFAADLSSDEELVFADDFDGEGRQAPWDIGADEAVEQLTQIHYRWRNDDGNEATATWAAAEDAVLNGLAKGSARRLRIEVSNEGPQSSSAVPYRLEVSPPGTCGDPFTPVPTTPAGHWQIVASSVADGTATTGQLTPEAAAFVPGEVKDAGNTSGPVTLDTDEFTEIEYSVQATANATAGALYCFRLVDGGGGGLLGAYPVHPQVTVAGATLVLSDHFADQAGDQFTTTTPVTAELFRFGLATSGGVTVDNSRVGFWTYSGVANGDVTAGELWADRNDDGLINGGDVMIGGPVAAANGLLTFTTNFDPAVQGTSYVVRATVANLVAGDLTRFSLVTGGIDVVEAGVTKVGSVTSSVHLQDGPSGAAGADVFYSVGTSRPTDLKTGSPTMTLSGGTATFSQAQTGDIGVGDEIDYDADNKIAYIKSVVSQTQFVLHTPTGAVPGDVTNATVNSIMRAFDSLTTAEANSGDPSHLSSVTWPATTNLTAAGVDARLTWVAYDDGVLSEQVNIAGFAVDASHYVTATVAGASQVASGNSQRHDGTAGTGVVVRPASGVGGDGFLVETPYVVVEWFEIDGTLLTGSPNDGVDLGDGPGQFALLQNLVIHGFDENIDSGIWVSAPDAVIRNSILYDNFGGIDVYYDDALIQNSTVVANLDHGVEVNSGSVGHVVDNVISMDNPASTDFRVVAGSFSAVNNCMSSDDTADDFGGSGHLVNQTSANQFVSTSGSIDLHLRPTADATNAGTNLSGSFTNDIDDETRGATWDMGADEAGVGVMYRSIGTAADYSVDTVTATNGSRTVTGSGAQQWLGQNRGRGDRITIDGVDYTILSVDSETRLTLTRPYSGPTSGGKAYNIARKFTTLQGWEDCVSFGLPSATVAEGDPGGTGTGPYVVPAGTDRMLWFLSGYEGPADPGITVSFGGRAMVEAATASVGTGPYGRVSVFYLLDAEIPAGSQSFIVTNGAPGAQAHAYGLLVNVDQTSPIVDTEWGSVLSAATVTTQAPFDVVQGGLAGAVVMAGDAGSYLDGAWGAGWVETNDQAVGSATFASASVTAPYGAAGTDAATATFNAVPPGQVMVAVSVRPTSGCEGVYSSSLVADGRKEIGIAYDDSAVPTDPDFTAGVLIDGSITDADHDITLTADGPNRHHGLEGQGVLLDNGASGSDSVSLQDDFVTVEWIEIIRGTAGGDGVHSVGQGPSNQLVLRNLLIHNVGSTGMQIEAGTTNADIYNNFVYDNPSRGLIVFSTSGTVRVLNNTFYDNNNNGLEALGASTPNVLIQNNVSHSNSPGDSLRWARTAPTATTSRATPRRRR